MFQIRLTKGRCNYGAPIVFRSTWSKVHLLLSQLPSSPEWDSLEKTTLAIICPHQKGRTFKNFPDMTQGLPGNFAKSRLDIGYHKIFTFYALLISPPVKTFLQREEIPGFSLSVFFFSINYRALSCLNPGIFLKNWFTFEKGSSVLICVKSFSTEYHSFCKTGPPPNTFINVCKKTINGK